MWSKNKILGYTLVIFFVFMLWLLLKPKLGLDPVLFSPNRVDSIVIFSANKKNTLTSAYDITSVCKEIQKCKLVSPDRVNINTGFTDLFFFVKNQNKIDIRIMYNYYNGILINANDLYFKNDNLNKIVINYLQKYK